MRIQRIILRVSDLDASIAFWTEKVGLGLGARAEAFAFVEGGAVQLTLNEVPDVPEDGSLTEIVLESEEVKAAYDELSGRGVPFEIDLRPVTTDGKHELWAAHFYDPDGHLASLTGWI